MLFELDEDVGFEPNRNYGWIIRITPVKHIIVMRRFIQCNLVLIKEMHILSYSKIFR